MAGQRCREVPAKGRMTRIEMDWQIECSVLDGRLGGPVGVQRLIRLRDGGVRNREPDNVRMCRMWCRIGCSEGLLGLEDPYDR